MAAVTPPAWLQAGSYAARTDRLSAITAQLCYAGFSADEATPLRPRQGVRPSYQGYQLKARAAGTPNMTVIVSGGVCFIDNHDINGYGTYVLINDADTTLTVAPAGGAGQFRKDSVCFSVYDAETAGAANECRLEIIQGPYAASAGVTVRGTIPPNGIVLADLAIAPSQTSVASGNITDARNFTASMGGIAPIPSTIAPNHPHPGQVWYEPDLVRFRYGKSDGSVGSIYPNLRYQTGSVNFTWTSGTAGQWVQVAVTFAQQFASTPTVHLTPQGNAPAAGGATTIMFQVTAVTTTGFTACALRSTAFTGMPFGWTAFQ